MNSIRSALYHVKRQLILNRIFSVFLDALLVFFSCAVLLLLIALPWFYAGIPMILYFVPMSIKRVREVKLKEAEEKIPELEWQLRTTEDTLGKENEVVESLQQRVFQKLMSIRKSYLMDSKTVKYKSAGIMGLFGVLIAFSLFHVFLLDANPHSPAGLFAKDQGSFNPANETMPKTTQGDRDIIEIDYDHMKDPQGRQFNQQNGLGDIGASSDASYQEHIDEENKKLVKNYFEKLSQEIQP